MYLCSNRRPLATLAFVFVSLLTACSGGAGNAGGALPTVRSSAAPASIISNSNGVIDLTGTVTAMITGGFQVQGGSGVGYLHIYVTSSTVITGPAPYVGENVEVVGTGSLSTGDITATSVKQLTASPSPSPSSAASSTPGSGTLSSPAPAGSPIPLPSGVIAASGQIVGTSSTRLTIQAGSGCGYMYIYLNSSTTYFNGSPQTGQYGEFTGPGTRCGSVTANTVTLSSSAITSTQVSGTVAQATSYGFLLSSGGSSIPVALTSQTVVFGAQLLTGSNVTVTGYGSATSAVTATQIAVAVPATPAPTGTPSPTPGPIAQTHMLTAGMLYGYGGPPPTTPLSAMAPWITWGQTAPQYAAQVRAAGVKVDIYTNFWRNYSSDNPIIGYTDLEPGGAHAAAEALDCNGNVIYDSAYGGGYEADARSAAALGHAQVVVNYKVGEYGSNYDAVFSDDTGSVGGYGMAQPCGYTQSAYDAATNSVHQALGIPLWVNALGGAANPATAIDLAQPSNVLGAMCEMCFAANNGTSDYVNTGTFWQEVENAEIGMVAQHRIFWDYARATGNPSAETQLRTYVYASVLLAYDPAYAMLQEAFQSASGFPVMPETGLVAIHPLTTATDVSGYLAAGGSYFRQFGACYYRGAFVANCAVVVNPTAGSVPVPTTSYTHSLTLTGGGVLDGGTAAFNGPQIGQLASGTAAILFP